MHSKSHMQTRMLTEGALFVAMAQVLSYVKLYEFPNGGSVTAAMLPILLFAVRWGLGPGLMGGFAFGLLQLIFDGAYAWGWQSMLLDYLVAFTPLGLAGGSVPGAEMGAFRGNTGRGRRPFCGPLYQRRHDLQDRRAYGISQPHVYQSRALLSDL